MMQNMSDSDRERIVVLEVELRGLREQQKAHAAETRESLRELDLKVDDIITIMNKGKGAFAFALMAAGAVGGLIAKAMGVLLSRL